MRQLHELLWYLTEALTLPSARPVHDELRVAFDDTERLTRLGPAALAELDVSRHRDRVNGLLLRTSELVRTGARPSGRAERRGADLIGKDLRGADLRGANLRGAYLIAAVLADADLRTADVIGADFRGADLRGADLRGSIFLIQSQVDTANGDPATKLPPSVTHPAHWSSDTPGR
jgi:hypothetical protein